MEWNKLTTQQGILLKKKRSFFITLLSTFGKVKLQKLMKKSLSIIQRHKTYTLISGLIMEKELVLSKPMKT